MVFFIANKLLKLPFDKEILNGSGLDSLLVRSARYAIVIFIIMGVYPIVFPWYERMGGRRKLDRGFLKVHKETQIICLI